MENKDQSSPVSGLDPAMTPTEFVDSILSACDPSNWDADLNKGDYYRGLRDAYEVIHEIACDYQTTMYDWTRRPDHAQSSDVASIADAIRAHFKSIGNSPVKSSDGIERVYYSGFSLQKLAEAIASASPDTSADQNKHDV